MTEWLLSIEGTEAGRRAALFLALGAAFLHALFGALQKGRDDPWASRAAIDLSYGLIAAPLALFVVDWPGAHLIPFLAGMVAIHVAYKLAQGAAYSAGAYTVVYPVVRGLGPLFTVLAAGAVFGETYAPMQWAGVGLLTAGIFGLAGYNLLHLREGRDTLGPALGWAVVTGALVALYTTWDAWGIRAVPDPFTFLAWFFFLDGFAIPLIFWRKLAVRRGAAAISLAKRGVFGALIAFASFGSVMLATRLDRVGEAAVLRETSTIFAALIGWLVLGERTGLARAGLMAMIAAGALVMEMAG